MNTAETEDKNCEEKCFHKRGLATNGRLESPSHYNDTKMASGRWNEKFKTILRTKRTPAAYEEMGGKDIFFSDIDFDKLSILI